MKDSEGHKVCPWLMSIILVQGYSQISYMTLDLSEY